jgi:hypothetical protein
VVEFCAAEEVSVPSFYQWRKKLAEQPKPGIATDGDPGGVDRGARQSPAFRQVRVVPTAPALMVRLAGGTRVEVPADNLPVVCAVLSELVRADRGLVEGDAAC